MFSLHKKRSFLWRVSLANVTKSAVSADLVTFIEEILHEKLHFVYSVYYVRTKQHLSTY